jgi:hypothetical protein
MYVERGWKDGHMYCAFNKERACEPDIKSKNRVSYISVMNCIACLAERVRELEEEDVNQTLLDV